MPRPSIAWTVRQAANFWYKIVWSLVFYSYHSVYCVSGYDKVLFVVCFFSLRSFFVKRIKGLLDKGEEVVRALFSYAFVTCMLLHVFCCRSSSC